VCFADRMAAVDPDIDVRVVVAEQNG
jgi:hypothetical protein